MRPSIAIAAACALTAVACAGGSSSMPVSPSSTPVTTAAPTASSVSGTWVGTASDSSGTMMGSGMTSSMRSNMTWQITQSGNAFTGTMQFQGFSAGMMTVSGIIDANTVTFTMTIPNGGMMASCSAVANGTLDLNAVMTQIHGTYSGSNTCTGMFTGGQMSMTRGGGSSTFTSNGQRIYLTATSASGQAISYRGGPVASMMGGGLACVSCHQLDGHGGQVTIMMQTFQAANISWAALANEDPPYTDATVKRAITQGIDSGGSPLESPMPRWSMSASDLDDLVTYLKTLQ